MLGEPDMGRLLVVHLGIQWENQARPVCEKFATEDELYKRWSALSQEILDSDKSCDVMAVATYERGIAYLPLPEAENG